MFGRVLNTPDQFLLAFATFFIAFQGNMQNWKLLCQFRMSIWDETWVLHGLQSRPKFMKQYQETKQNWTKRENFDICFCVIFDHSYQFYIWRVDWVPGSASPIFDVCPIFPNFQRS